MTTGGRYLYGCGDCIIHSSMINGMVQCKGYSISTTWSLATEVSTIHWNSSITYNIRKHLAIRSNYISWKHLATSMSKFIMQLNSVIMMCLSCMIWAIFLSLLIYSGCPQEQISLFFQFRHFKSSYLARLLFKCHLSLLA